MGRRDHRFRCRRRHQLGQLPLRRRRDQHRHRLHDPARPRARGRRGFRRGGRERDLRTQPGVGLARLDHQRPVRLQRGRRHQRPAQRPPRGRPRASARLGRPVHPRQHLHRQRPTTASASRAAPRPPTIFPAAPRPTSTTSNLDFNSVWAGTRTSPTSSATRSSSKPTGGGIPAPAEQHLRDHPAPRADPGTSRSPSRAPWPAPSWPTARSSPLPASPSIIKLLNVGSLPPGEPPDGASPGCGRRPAIPHEEGAGFVVGMDNGDRPDRRLADRPRCLQPAPDRRASGPTRRPARPGCPSSSPRSTTTLGRDDRQWCAT